MNCVRCRIELSADARFCAACGAPQVVGPRAEAEKRHLTVVFCDLVGSVALSTTLDPEDLRDLIRAYQAVCSDAITRFEGHVAQFLGDGVLAYFGYPAAHEDDARRAVHAALHIVAALKPRAAQWRRERGVEVRLRVGVHSGATVIGDMGPGPQGSPIATGETPNIAARIQSLAEPDTIYISAATYTLVRGYFRCESVTPTAVKGIEQPLALYRVLAETGAVSRLSAAGERGLMPFVGRATMLDGLVARWTAVQRGSGQVVLLSGDAGIGKSRLLRTLRERIATDHSRALETQCSPYAQNSAFAPIIDLIQRELRITPDLDADARTVALRAGLAQVPTADSAETLSLMAALLSITPPPDQPALNITPQRQRRRTIETLSELIVASARRAPTLLVFEDLHWADPSSLEVLDDLVAHAGDAPLLVALTFRPEFVPVWSRRPGVSDIALDPLPDDAARAVVANMTGEHVLPDSVIRRVLARAEGNPLYLEEITRVVIDAGGPNQPGSSDTMIPATVQESLLARIDRLGPAKAIAQLASAIGRQFSYELLSAMAGLPPLALHDALNRLVGEDLLIQHGTRPDATFAFKHALLQDAAYQSLLRSRRQEIHGLIAQTLVEKFTEVCEAQPELPARHYTEAGRTRDAIPLWRKAGERAVARSAQAEAASHLSRALDLARTLPADAERVQAELALLITLGPLLMATQGFADPRVELTYRQAHEICVAIGDTPQILPVLYGLWSYYIVSGGLRMARDLVEQIIRVTRASGDSSTLIHAMLGNGVTLFFLGELEGAKRALTSAIELHNPVEHRAHAALFGHEPGMASHLYLACTLAVMGDGTGATEHARKATEIADATNHFHSSARCMADNMTVRHLAGDAAGTAAIAPRCIALSEEQGFPLWKANAEALGAWAELTLGDAAGTGLAHLREAIEHWHATGTTLYEPYWMCLLASALSERGQLDEARRLIDAAVAQEVEGEERVSLAELYRVQAEIVLRQGGSDASALARRILEQALTTARAQHAGLWEQRTLTSLAQITGEPQ